MDKEVIENATPEQFYENVSGRLYTLSLNQTGGVDCNMYCSIKDIEEKDKKIANLKAKLAESEKTEDGAFWFEKWQHKKRDYDSVYKAYIENCAEIDQLKQQLADALKDFNDIQEENDKLAQQLQEEKNRNKKLNHEAQKYYEDAYCNGIQNQKAIAELEKVVEFMKTRDECGFFPEQMSIAEYIDQQIAELKGESK